MGTRGRPEAAFLDRRDPGVVGTELAEDAGAWAVTIHTSLDLIEE